MGCMKYDSLIDKSADNELSLQEKKLLEEHVKTCVSCNNKLSFYRKLEEKSKNAGISHPEENFTASVLKKIENIPGHSPWSYDSIMLKLRWAIAAIAAIASLLVPICGY